jgi:hypothetical protein
MTQARVVRFARFDSDPAPVALTEADTIDETRSNGNLERSGTEPGGEGATAPWWPRSSGRTPDDPRPT